MTAGQFIHLIRLTAYHTPLRFVSAEPSRVMSRVAISSPQGEGINRRLPLEGKLSTKLTDEVYPFHNE